MERKRALGIVTQVAVEDLLAGITKANAPVGNRGDEVPGSDVHRHKAVE